MRLPGVSGGTVFRCFADERLDQAVPCVPSCAIGPDAIGEVLQLIDSGAVVHELAMTLEGEASFVFSSSAIKRITLPDIAPQEGEPLTEEEEANANLILSGTAVARIYEALTVELGGLAE